MTNSSSHRPWEMPKEPWAFFMRWHDLLLAHWPLPPEVLRPLIPVPLALDTFERQAWIGIAPFRMTRVHLRNMPPLPGFSSSLEINVRTYVTFGGKPGVWFFSLDAANPAAVWMARHFFHLPYYRARMSCAKSSEVIHYESRRHRSNTSAPHSTSAHFRAQYRPTGKVAYAKPGSLDYWLAERYCLYAKSADGKIWRSEIHHSRWPLQPAEASIEVNSMTSPLRIELPSKPPLLHFSRQLDTFLWKLKAVA